MENQNLQIVTSASDDRQFSGTKIDREPPSAAEIQAWITSYLAELLEVAPEEIDPTIPFDRYGLDSVVAVGMTGELEDWLDRKLDPTLLYDYPTVESFSNHLAEEFAVTA